MRINLLEMTSGKQCCKVGKLIEHYELRGITNSRFNDDLVARWIGDDEFPAMSITDLTDWFNKRLLRHVYTMANRQALDSHLEADYQTLTGDNDIERQNVRADLETDGIDGNLFPDQFVSNSTLYRHLTGCLETQKGREGDSSSNWESTKLQYSIEYTERQVGGILPSLDKKGALPGASNADVEISVIIECPLCDNSIRLTRAMDRGFICSTHRDKLSELSVGNH